MGRLALALALGGFPLAACSSDSGAGNGDDGSGSESCALGTEGCACTAGGTCDPGLECRSGICVAPGGDGGGGSGTSGGADDGGTGSGGTSATGTSTGTGTGTTGGELPDWGAPTPITTLAVSAADAPSVTADLRELFFQNNTSGNMDIYVSTRASASDPWGSATAVSELNTSSNDTTAEVAPDGLTIWITSERPGGAGARDIWVSSRPTRAAAWSAPTNVTELNTPQDEQAASSVGDTLTIVFHSTRDAADGDIYVATRASVGDPWSGVTPIAELNTTDTEWTPHLTEDELTIYICTDRPGGLGGRDTWMATRAAVGGEFQSLQPLTVLNSTANDCGAWFSPDQRYTVFGSGRTGGGVGLWEASR